MKKLALNFPGGGEPINDPTGFKFASGNIGNIINALVPYIFALAGLALLLVLILAGFEMMTSAGDPKKMESAKGRLTGAVIGFVIIFVAYWLVQILEVIFGLKIF
ncbi:hypothetical protein A2Z41_02635 [Microgenomates group bacterium RBG_19FT_COMBO_39_10]|nr:MAG: hypothetical protein A2Z41_02635 [Microgenomates group bacterium RBG_19FT_COMBO_39_10]